nr:transcription termination/antitermination protein NusG [Rhizobium sp. Q54]
MAKWYVVRVRAGRQARATQDLRNARVEFYQPVMRKEIRHHQTKKWIMREFPVFTGYVFASLWISDFGKLRDMPYVLGILGDGEGSPIPISNNVVQMVMDAQDRGDFDELRPTQRRLRPGTQVQVMDGPLAGHYTTITSVVGKRAIRAVVGFLGSHREVEIPVEKVRKVA